MADTIGRIMNLVFKLDKEARAELAFQLFQSYDWDPAPTEHQALIKELEKRVREIDEGRSKLVSWEAVKRRLKAQFRQACKTKRCPDCIARRRRLASSRISGERKAKVKRATKSSLPRKTLIQGKRSRAS